MSQNVSIINSIFPSLIFNNFTLSSDNDSGICDKLGLKDSIFSLCGYTVQIQEYLFERIKVKFNLKGDHSNEIIIQNAKIKIQVLSNEISKENHNFQIGTDILINHLEIEFFKEDTSLLNLNSSNAQIFLRKQNNFSLTLPSCEVMCQGNHIIKSTNFQILLDIEKSSFLITSDHAHLCFPIETMRFLFPLFYSILNNIQSTTISFKTVDIYINTDTKVVVTNFIFEIGTNGDYSLTFPKCELNLSSFHFTLSNFKLDNKNISIQNIGMNNIGCSICPVSGNDKDLITIQGKINKESNSIKIDVTPIICTFTLSRFRNFIKLILKNSFWNFLINLPNWKIFIIEFKDVFLNIQIDNNFTLYINYNFIYTSQPDVILMSSTSLSYHFNNNSPITKGQVFQYSCKNEINQETKEAKTTTSIFLSQLVYTFSIDEISPFLQFLKKMSKPISDIFFKGTVNICFTSIQIFIGPLIKGTNDHSQFIDISLAFHPIQISTTAEDHSFNTSVTFSVKYLNSKTKFWDSVIDPNTFQFIFKFNEFKRHISFFFDEEISINLTSQFLSSLISLLKNPVIERTPDYFVSNYTNSTINISIQESPIIMAIKPMNSQPLSADPFYLILDGNKKVKFSALTITSRTFVRNNLFIDVDMKDGTKNVFFMNIMSIENKLGMDLRILYKEKHSFVPLMSLNHKERRGFTKPVNFQMSFAAIPLTNNVQPSSSGGLFGHKHEQYQSITPKKYKSIAYTIKGVDSDRDVDCLVYLRKNEIDKSKVILFLPKYEIENRLPFSISLNCKHMKAVSAVSVESLKKKAVLMPCDVNQPFEITVKISEKDESKPTVVSLKLEPLKQQEYELNFEKCQLPLTVSLGDSIPIIRFVVKCPITVFNRSSSSFNVNKFILQKEKFYQIPLFESEGSPALFVSDQAEPQIEIPVTSYPETIRFLNPPFLEKESILMLKNKDNEKLFTPLKVLVRRDLIRGNLIYLYDFIHVKNSTKRPINFILEQDSNKMRLRFEPGVTSPLLISNEDKSFRIEIDGYKRSNLVFLGYATDTVMRFIRNEKLNRRKKEGELHIRIVITENEEGQNEIELSDATFESSPYLIVNDTDYILYAQQTENWIPLRVQPRSSTVFAFDDPFQKTLVVLTVEGKSLMCHFSNEYFNTDFPFKIEEKCLYLNTKTNKYNQRVISVSDKKEEIFYDYFISMITASIRVTLFTFDQEQLLTILSKNIRIVGKSEEGLLTISSTVQYIQIDDETENLGQGVIFCGGSNKLDTNNFISMAIVTSSASKHINLSQLIAFSLEVNPMDIQINSDTFTCFRKFLIEANVSNFNFIRNIFIHQSINTSYFVISPIVVNLFIRKNTNEGQLANMHLFHILPIQVPSLVNFTLPSILINKISCTFESLNSFISSIYSKLLTLFFSISAGQQPCKETVTYPLSFFENVNLSLNNLNTKLKIDMSWNEVDLVDVMHEDEFHELSMQCQQDNTKKTVTVEVGHYKNSNDSDNNISLINNNSFINSGIINSNNNTINEVQSKENLNNSIPNMISSQPSFNATATTGSNNPASALLSLFTSSTPSIPSRDDFHFIKDENQINNTYNSKLLKRIEYHKIFQLNRIEPINLKVYNTALSLTKKKKNPLYFQTLSDKSNLMIFDDCIVVVDSEQIKMDIPFSSIVEFSNDRTTVKVTIKPEKPKLPPKIVELKFNTVFIAETSMNEMISHLMMNGNK